MAEQLIGFWLALLTLLQVTWCVYYATRYDWRATPLGPVWLAKGSALAVLWPLLAVNQIADIHDLVWGVVLGPLLAATTGAWLFVTVRTKHRPR